MIINIYIISSLISLFIIGVWRIRNNLKLLIRRIIFLQEYRNKFINLSNFYFSSGYAAARSSDPQLYYWLTLNSNKAQREVGAFGIGEFIAPFRYYQIKNYHFIVNTLPKFNDGHIHPNEVNTVDNILLRSIGYLQELEIGLRVDLKNPIKWLQHGIKFILSLPARILNWFGIIHDHTIEKIDSNGVFKIIADIVGLLSVLGTVITIFTGWAVFSKMIMEMLKRI